MSKLSEALRAKKIINHYDVLTKFGGIVVEYWPSPGGRAGIGNPSHSVVWSLAAARGLEKRRSMYTGAITYYKQFLGRKDESFPLAVALAKEICGEDLVPSPVSSNDRMPRSLRKKLEEFAR